LFCLALAAWDAWIRTLPCAKAICDINVACLHFRACTQIMRGSSLLGIVLEPHNVVKDLKQVMLDLGKVGYTLL
jgi:hypothetical protein